MLTQTASIERFEKNMDELINCSYILCDNKISALLKGISTSKLFYELFGFCTEGFDYFAARKKYFVLSKTGGKFVLPTDKKVLIALVFSLLYCIDGKDEDFAVILSDYFYEQNVNLSYKRFAKEVLVPFRIEVLSVAHAMVKGEASEKREAPVEGETVTVRQRRQNLLSDKNIEIIKACLEQSKSVILQYKIDAEPKAELIALYDNFKSALYDSDPDRIKIAYIGYKYGILFHKKHDSGLVKIEEILKNGGIL